MSNLNNYIEYVNNSIETDPTEFIDECEYRYRKIISTISKRIDEDKNIEIIFLAGPSSSGKTTTSRLLADSLDVLGRKTHTISLDDFYLNREDALLDENGEPDFECLEALDLELINKTIFNILNRKDTDLPIFNFNTGKREDVTWKLKLEQGDIVVFEGLHALNPVILNLIPKKNRLSLFVNVSSRIYDKRMNIILNKRNIRFIRRVMRDYQYRSSSVENTYKMWQKVREGEKKYLFPFKANADINVNSTHLYEISVYKNTILKLLNEITPESEFYSDAMKLTNSIKMFKPIPVQAVPSNSLLNEFIFKNSLKP